MFVIIGTVTLFLLEFIARAYFVWQTDDFTIFMPTLRNANTQINGGQNNPPTASIFPHHQQKDYANYYPGSLPSYISVIPPGWVYKRLQPYTIKINAQGFRGEDFTERTDPNELRIVCLGESSTFGYLLKDEETYPVKLEKKLTALLKRPVKVFNLGVSESVIDWDIAILQNWLKFLKPDIVTYYGLHNDVRDLTQITNRARSLPFIFSYIAVLPKLLDWHITSHLSWDDKFELSEQSLSDIKQKVFSLKKAAESEGAQFFFVAQTIHGMDPKLKVTSYDQYYKLLLERKKDPDSGWGYPDVIAYWHYPLVQSLKTDKNLSVIDFSDQFYKKIYFHTHVHPSPEGTDFMSDHLANEIADRLTGSSK
ncbi:MAG: SGNH/GDSL hydrolase family protein [Pseudobdellovibrio sp.]